MPSPIRVVLNRYFTYVHWKLICDFHLAYFDFIQFLFVAKLESGTRREQCCQFSFFTSNVVNVLWKPKKAAALFFCDTPRVAFFGRHPKVCNTFPLALVTQQDVAHFIGSRFLTKMPILRIGQHRGNKLRCLQLQLGQTLLQQLVALHQFDSL